MLDLATVSAAPGDPSTVLVHAIVSVPFFARVAFTAGYLSVCHCSISQLRVDCDFTGFFGGSGRLVAGYGSQGYAEGASVLGVWVAKASANGYGLCGHVPFVRGRQFEFFYWFGFSF